MCEPAESGGAPVGAAGLRSAAGACSRFLHGRARVQTRLPCLKVSNVSVMMNLMWHK